MSNNGLILIIDDSATMRLIIADALKNAGFEIIEAENGEVGLSLLKTAKPDGILLDVEMPGLNGFEVCAEIRKLPEYQYTPIMMVTGLEDFESIQKAFIAGATDFTSKPVNPTLIGYRVRYMLRTSNYFQDLMIAEKKAKQLNSELEKTILEIQRNSIAATRFVPKDFLKILNKKNIADVELGDCVEKTMSVLFLDIRSFTTLSEQFSPVEIFNFFNTLMGYLEPGIIKNKGFIDKYIGDAILALFTSPDNAVQAALDILTALDEFNDFRISVKLSAIGIGIGINTGSLVLGTVGYKDRIDCSVISDAVNIASRVESFTRAVNADLLIGEETYKQLQDKEIYECRLLGAIPLKGKTLPIKIYEVLNHDPEKIRKLKNEYASTFQNALDIFEDKKFHEASNLFRQILSKNPEDFPAAYFLNICESKNKA